MQNSILRWTTRILGGLFALFILLAGAGALYQWRATAWDRQENPPPGELVDIGDHRLHLYCTGSGKPTVILESGAINTYLTWARVQPEVARFTRVCSYDRAGHGWSSPIDEPKRSTDVAADLRQLLREAGLEPPYVLAGHSRGGLHVRTFQSRYPDTVVGMVLIDSAHEQAYPRYPAAYHEALDEQGSIFAVARWLAPLGVVRLLGMPEQQVQQLPLPPEQQAALAAIWSQSHVYRMVVLQGDAWIKDENQPTPPDSLGNVPLVVVSRGQARDDIPGLSSELHEQAEETHQALQRELAVLSADSEHWVAEESGHAIPWEQPAIVVRAIRHVWEQTPPASDANHP